MDSGDQGRRDSPAVDVQPQLRNQRWITRFLHDRQISPVARSTESCDETFVDHDGVPQEIIDRLNTATVAVIKAPEIQRRCESQGWDPIPSTSSHYAAYLKSEIEKWRNAVRAAKIDLE